MTPIIISSAEVEGATILLAESIELIEDENEYAEALKEQYLNEIKTTKPTKSIT